MIIFGFLIQLNINKKLIKLQLFSNTLLSYYYLNIKRYLKMVIKKVKIPILN